MNNMNKIWTPDKIKAFERDFEVICALLPDGMYDVEGSIHISKRDLKDLALLPPIRTLSGDFWCSTNSLVTLEGAPRSVGGYFVCSNNSLVSLEGAPRSVGKGFECPNNSLVSIEGAPRSVGGHFWCSNNSLVTLEGAPMSVGGNFLCKNNPDLRFTRSQLDAMNIQGGIYMEPNQLIPGDPSEFIEKGILPI